MGYLTHRQASMRRQRAAFLRLIVALTLAASNLLASGAVTFVSALLVPPPASSVGVLSAPGTPGIPSAPVTVFTEDFQNVPQTPTPNTSQIISSYVSTTGTQYTADAYWRNTAVCNGVVADFSTTSAQSCATSTYASFGAGLMKAMGIENGSADPNKNYGLLEITAGSNPTTADIQLKSTNGVSTAQSLNGRFVTFGITIAVTTCQLAGGRPNLALGLITNSIEIPTGTGINPCTDPRGHTSTVTTGGGGAIRVGKYFPANSVLVSTVGQLDFIVHNLNTTGSGNDMAFDDVRILDATPQLDKSFSPAAIAVGGTSTLTFTITNTNDLSAKNGWSFTDALPAGLTITNPSSATTTCSSGAVTATAGGTSVAVTGNLNVNQVSCTASVNVTSSTVGTYSNGPSNVTTVGLNPPGTTPLTVGVSDLAITKTTAATYTPGAPISYTMTATNNGPSPVLGATVDDALPASITNSSWTCTPSAGNACGAASGTGSIHTTLNLAVGGTATFTLTGTVASGATGALTNTATIAPPTGTTDPIPGNNTGPATSQPAPRATLAVTKSSAPNPYIPGQPLAYTITVTNQGPSDVTGATVDDTLPAPIAGFTWSCTTSGAGNACGAASGAGDIHTMVNLVNGGVAIFTLTGVVPLNTTGAIVNTAVATPPTGTSGTPGTGTDTGASVPPPDLSLAKTHSGTFTVGQNGSYTLTVSNAPASATVGATYGPVTVSDTLPTGLNPTAASGTGWTCTVAAPTVTCTRSDALAPGASYPAITLTVAVLGTAASTPTNSATVTTTGDPNPINNITTDPTTVLRPDLVIAKSHTGSFVRGTSGTYTLTATNGGTGATTGTVTVTDTLPAGLTATAISGTGWTCTLATLICTRGDALAAGTSYPVITVTVAVGQNATAAVSNTVTVGGGSETNTSNDSATDQTTITSRANLAITKTASINPLLVGTPFDYTETISNSGPSDATLVHLADTLQPGLTFNSATPSQGTCSGTATVACDLGTIVAGASAFVTITVTPTLAGSITNTATVTSPESTAMVTTSSTNRATNAVLSIAKSASPAAVVTGDQVTYTITVADAAGTADAANVTITDPLPVGTTFVSATPSQGSCLNTPPLTCALGTIANGTSTTITIVVTVTQPGTQQNFAQATSPNDPAAPITAMATTNATQPPPVATDDFATTPPNTAVPVNVLGNDASPSGTPLTVTSNTQPAHGTVSCTPAGICTYTPNANFTGTDTFTYTITDGNGKTATATVHITVPIPAPPVALDDSVTTTHDTPVGVIALGNDVSPTGAPLTLTGNTQPAHGTVTCTPTGACTYTPAPGFSGTDSFTYTITDPFGQTSTATVHVTVTPPVFAITSGPGTGTPGSPHLPAGANLQLTFTSGGLPVPASAVSCTANNGQIATVDASGKVHGITPGSVTVTCTYNGQTVTMTVTIDPIGFTAVNATVVPRTSANPAGVGNQPPVAVPARGGSSPAGGGSNPAPPPPGR